MITFEHFKRVFDEKIFSNSKSDLITKIARDPDRFVGIYRSTTPQEKLSQNLSQSHEIRFGDAFESIIQDVFFELGYGKLEKKISDSAGKQLNIDQLVRAEDGEVIFVEQKVRDDHDSTKKVGQAANFRNKILALREIYGSDLSRAFVFFIDPSRKKNKNYYVQRAREFEEETGVACYVFYGEDLFKQLGLEAQWITLIDYLRRWKAEVPVTPSFNFDEDPADSAAEIITKVKVGDLKKILSDERVVQELFPVLFPNGDTLRVVGQEMARSGTHQGTKVAQMISVLLKNMS